MNTNVNGHSDRNGKGGGEVSKILLTGGNGFLGKAVSQKLLSRGHSPIVFDRKAPAEVLGDIKDAEAVNEAVYNSDAVIHLAGLLGTAELTNNPRIAAEVNILGTLNVFKAIRTHKKRAVYITLGNYFMNNTYSITKSTSERFALMFNKEHGTDIRIVRGLNVYGPGQKAAPVKKFFPNAAISVLKNEPITIYGDGEQIMDLVYLDDIAEILVRALLTDNIPNNVIYEAGNGQATTLNYIVGLMIALAGSRSEIRYVPMRPRRTQRSSGHGYRTGSGLYERLLGICEFHSVRKGVEERLGVVQRTYGACVPCGAATLLTYPSFVLSAELRKG